MNGVIKNITVCRIGLPVTANKRGEQFNLTEGRKYTVLGFDEDIIIENACDELHEDARDNISDEKELQEFLDKWCEKQTGTTTYYPCYKEYVRVKKEWFD